MNVTESQLADALTEFRTAVRPDGGRVGAVQPGWIAFPQEAANTIFATLGRMAALREDEPEPGQPAAAVTRERLIDALRGARVTITTGGGRVRQGEIAQPHGFASYLYDCLTQPGEPEAREADTDPELAAMAALLPALPLVSALRPDARERVMDWGRRRACDGQPPF